MLLNHLTKYSRYNAQLAASAAIKLVSASSTLDATKDGNTTEITRLLDSGTEITGMLLERGTNVDSAAEVK